MDKTHIPLFVLRRDVLKGTYTLLLTCDKPLRLRVGRIGQTLLKKGHYLYTGSALGIGGASLERRVARHRRRTKPRKWHVDYLTVRPEIRVRHVICLQSDRRLECQINQHIISKLNAQPIGPHAGATDCKCTAHLLSVKLHEGLQTTLARLEGVYSDFGTPFSL
jgi:Uri superfamily endonuclease